MATDRTDRTVELLEQLDHIATRVIATPHLAFGYRVNLGLLRMDIGEEVVAAPGRSRGIDDTATMLVICLANASRDSASKWIDIAKVLHPYVQVSLAAACKQEVAERTEQS